MKVFSNKSFLGIKDFYNFIKGGERDQRHTPTDFWYFSVNLYLGSYSTSNDMSNNFFESYASNSTFECFRYCVQQVTLPTSISIKSYSSIGTGSEGVKDISSIYGGTNILSNNSFLHPDKREFSMTILNTQKPLIETFLYDWMNEVVRTNIGKNDSWCVPKLDMAIKYWSPSSMEHEMEDVKPDFVYYITGVYPTKITLYNPKQVATNSGGDISRNVTFAFDDIVIIPNTTGSNKQSPIYSYFSYLFD